MVIGLDQVDFLTTDGLQHRRPGGRDVERPIQVVDEVGSALVDWNHQDAVRIETWNTVSTPPPDKKLMRMISQSGLRGR